MFLKLKFGTESSIIPAFLKIATFQRQFQINFSFIFHVVLIFNLFCNFDVRSIERLVEFIFFSVLITNYVKLYKRSLISETAVFLI